MTTAAPDTRSAGSGDVASPVLHHRPVDLDRAATAVGDLLQALGLDVTSDGLAETPARVARLYAELLSPQPF